MNKEQLLVLRSVAFCSLLSSLVSFLANKCIFLPRDIDVKHEVFAITFILLSFYSLKISLSERNPPDLFYYFYIYYDNTSVFIKFVTTILFFYAAVNFFDSLINGSM